MIKVCEQIPLYVGDQHDYEREVRRQPGWSVVQACKEPYHRQALGYSGRGAPKDDPEYLIAYRDNRLILNLVDAPSPDYIPMEIVDTAITFIGDSLQDGKEVLVHCNEGRSRSPSLTLLYLAIKGLLPNSSLRDAEVVFSTLYPDYAPKAGIRGFIEQHWERYIGQ